MYILGISAYYHDSAACLLKNGEIIAAAEEERFTRIKHDSSFPNNAIKYCLKEAKISASQLSYVGFYEKPIVKFERILQTFTECYPSGFWMFHGAMPAWINEKLRVRSIIRKKLGFKGKIVFIDHHTSHASSAFFVSPFKKAAIMTVDGVGEWTTTSIQLGEGNAIKPLEQVCFPHSLGLLYSTFTVFLGFHANNDEYKVMGLAAYGKPRYISEMKKLIKIGDDGSFLLDMKYFDYRSGKRMWSREFENLFGKSRKEGEAIEIRHKDLAASLQKVLEEAYTSIARHAFEITKSENLCIAGGVGLNSVANGMLFESTPFQKIFVQPAATDAGGALGVAYYIWNCIEKNKRNYEMRHSAFGPNFSNAEIRKFLRGRKASFSFHSRARLLEQAASLIADGRIVGWFQGSVEWGPRALGNRSILADPTNPKMKDIVNIRIKRREDFRPFAGSVLQEDVHKYFHVPEKNHRSPFMNFVFKVRKEKIQEIPSIVHVDGTCRIQTVSRDESALYYDLIKQFKKLTGVPVLLNTSFNLKGEPIVCTPQEAYEDFLKTPMDYLMLGNFIVKKGGSNQKKS